MAPLPNWRDLFAVAFNSAAPDEVLAAPWCRPSELAFLFSSSALSLAVVASWQQQLLGKQNVIVWLPDFFCNASLAPLREMGANLVFYPVTEHMIPDLVACQDFADQQPMDLFVLVHYFGQPNPAEPIATFCEKHGAWLIEDAAHVLRPIVGVGETGDCVLYSPHKHLPIPDGAVLVVRPNGPARLAKNGLAMNVFSKVRAAVLATAGRSSRPTVLWLMKRLSQRLGLRARPSVTAFKAVVETSVAVFAHPRMSILARRLLTPLLAQLQTVATQREQNAQTWCNVLAWASTETAVMSPQVKGITYLAGFSANNPAGTEALFDRFQQAGLPVTTWPDLPPEVLASPDTYPAATALRNSRFYLPVHQTLSQHQLLACGKSLLDTTILKWQAKALSRDEWEVYWQRCHMTNMLQSWQYGEAKEQSERWKVQRFLIMDENEQPIALAQLLTWILPFIGGIARLNRGPLLLSDQSADAEVHLKLAALRVLLRVARRQHWWLLQAAPELLDTEPAKSGLQALGFKKFTAPAWASGRMSLQPDEQALLMGLKGKWRNSMRKGENLGVTVTHHECKGEALTLLMQSYTDLQSSRGFDGLSKKLISALAGQHGAQWQFNLFVARENTMPEHDDPLGLLVTVRSGDTALYLIGSTNDKGRQMQANSVLLWQAILHAKHSACNWFDIGGLSEATPEGIAKFKQGLNAMPYELVGEWRRYSWVYLK